MPSVTFNLFDVFRESTFDGTALDITTATLKISLHTNTYTPNQNTDDFWDNATNEVSGTNYTAGGNACTTGTVALNGSGLVTVDANDPAVWAQSAGGFNDAILAVLYDDTGTPATSPLVGFSDDFAAAKGNVDGAFSVTFDAAGIFTAAR